MKKRRFRRHYAEELKFGYESRSEEARRRDPLLRLGKQELEYLLREAVENTARLKGAKSG